MRDFFQLVSEYPWVSFGLGLLLLCILRFVLTMTQVIVGGVLRGMKYVFDNLD